MEAPAKVLILEDDADEMARLKNIVSALRMVPLEATYPSQALRLLEYHSPVLAILDLDMSKSKVPDRATTRDVLRKLNDTYRNVIPLVHSAKVETIWDQQKLSSLHPYTLYHPKKSSEFSLQERIEKLLNARLGDLLIRNGRVFHQPTNKQFKHYVAVELLMARRTGGNNTVFLNESQAKAARRFKQWLAKRNSSVSVHTHGNRQYSVYIIDQEDPEESLG